MAKFFIAISLLYKLKKINSSEKEELEDTVWENGGIIWNKDARIAFGYRGSLQKNELATFKSLEWEALEIQNSVGLRMLQLRDSLAALLQTIW